MKKIFVLLLLAACASQPTPAKTNLVSSPKYPVVTPPACPDWSSQNYGVNIENKEHSNYGCSTVNNMGQMVANPNDMIKGRGNNNYNAVKTAVSVGAYQSGAQSGASSSAASASSGAQ
jgi:type IV pilus biogenesis protein CpaD/CtpE